VVDPIRHECYSTIRPYFDAPDVEVPIYWYRAPPGAKEIPRTIFGNPTLSQPGFKPVLGTTHKFGPANRGNYLGRTGQSFCGDYKAWTQGVSITSTKPCGCPNCMCVPLQETLGQGDGITRTFTTSQMPVSATSCLVFVGGLLQEQGVNYSISGKTITFSKASTPSNCGSVVVYYIWTPP
jgi:hypothetical protein